MKYIILFVFCLPLLLKAQTGDSLVSYLNMSLTDLLELKIKTASKQDQSISEIPASVVVITKDEIEAHGYSSLEEILSNALGMYKIDDYNNTGFGIRGAFSNVYNRNIVFMINGVRQQQPYQNYNDFNTMLVQVEAIERIEFIKSPVAVIYGNDAFLGVINIITYQKVKSSPSSTTASYGSNNTLRANVQVNATNETSTINIASGYNNTDGRDIPFSPILDSVQRYDKTWLKNATTKEFFKNEGRYMIINAEHKGFYANVNIDETIRNFIPIAAPILDTVKQNRRDMICRTNIGYRFKINQKYKFDINAGIVGMQWTNTYDKMTVEPDVSYGTDNAQAQQDFLNIVGFLKPTGKLNITTGIDYSDILFANELVDIPAIGYDRVGVSTITPCKTLAAYAQLDYTLFKKVLLNVGFRVDKQTSYKYQNSKIVDNKYVDTVYSYSYNKANVIPRAAIIYKIDEQNIVKLLYSQAISRPGIYENAYLLWQVHQMLFPQYIYSKELNYSSTLNKRLSFNVSIFNNIIVNMIQQRSFLQSAEQEYITNKNSGKMESLGSEVQCDYKPNDNLQVDAGLSYQNTMNLQYHVEAGYSPRMLANVKVSYHFNKHTIIAVNAYYVGEMLADWDETTNGRIGRAAPSYINVAVNIRINNIFNTHYFVGFQVKNMLDSKMYYPATFANRNFFPNGTYDTGVLLNGTIGLKF